MTRANKNHPATEWICLGMGKSGDVLVTVDEAVKRRVPPFHVSIETSKWTLSYGMAQKRGIADFIEAIRASEMSSQPLEWTAGSFGKGTVRFVCNDESPTRTTVVISGRPGDSISWTLDEKQKKELLAALEDALRDASA